MSRINNVLLAMITLRIISAFLEFTAAIFMFYFNNIEKAIKINALLGLMGPVILILVTFLGIVKLSHNVDIKNIFIIALGVILIIIGTSTS